MSQSRGHSRTRSAGHTSLFSSSPSPATSTSTSSRRGSSRISVGLERFAVLAGRKSSSSSSASASGNGNGSSGGEVFDYQFNVLVVGDTCTGKTNFLSRLAGGPYLPECAVTVGVEPRVFKLRTALGNKHVLARLYDTAGVERDSPSLSPFYSGAVGAFVFYDVSDRQTFYNVSAWLEHIFEAPRHVEVMLVGNKKDIIEELREVSTAEGSKLALDHGLHFVEISCKDPDSALTEALPSLVNAIHHRLRQSEAAELSHHSGHVTEAEAETETESGDPIDPLSPFSSDSLSLLSPSAASLGSPAPQYDTDPSTAIYVVRSFQLRDRDRVAQLLEHEVQSRSGFLGADLSEVKSPGPTSTSAPHSPIDTVPEPGQIEPAFFTREHAPRDHLWVVIEQTTDTVFGTAALRYRDGKTAELVRLFVDPCVRGRGLAFLLLKAVTAFARGEGYKEVIALVLNNESSAAAMALLKRFGFRNEVSLGLVAASSCSPASSSESLPDYPSSPPSPPAPSASVATRLCLSLSL